ncbi:MAG: S-methyl-5-thioribose-1-phosphate isomerase [Deltaproteobacteria bacterium]|nr:S-methyl-5-thioribose-1-phosphate isomerase [Deltaproteobacteria bacterium]
MKQFQTINWCKEGSSLRLLDQRQLPNKKTFLECGKLAQVCDAIETLAVRGAPAIGVAGAYGVVVGVQEIINRNQALKQEDLGSILGRLAATRPTAVNLFWALARMEKIGRDYLAAAPSDHNGLKERLLQEAEMIYAEDEQAHRRLGEVGAALIPDGARVLTHCNAGALACAAYGTALGVLRTAWTAGKRFQVYADETRPLLQGSRLTAWELQEDGIPVTLICDNMAAHCMRQGKIDLVIVGADRIAANGDTANKIGTYGVSLAAKAHNLPFYVAAPTTTIDFSLTDGSLIPIEERDPEEVRCCGGKRMAPTGVAVYNPAFDITPAGLITAIITERGLVTPDRLADLQQHS